MITLKPRVLVFLDDEVLRQETAKYLGARGCQAISAATGPQVVGQLRSREFDVMICDVTALVQVPPDVIGGLQEKRRRPHILLVSGQSDQLDGRRFQELGIRRVLHTPVDFQALFRTVDDLASTTASGGERILLVEDDPRIAGLVAKVLSREFQVTVAKSSWDALSARGEDFDLMILDMMMPGLSGDQVFAGLDNSVQGNEVVVNRAPTTLLMTALPETHPDVAALLLHPVVAGYVPKPFSIQQLRDAVTAALRQAHRSVETAS
jgi:DNA-binding response OmpR family regulator